MHISTRVPRRRAAAVRARLATCTLGEALWPRLALVSCWADAAAADAVPALHRYVPHARIQPKGLLATEGVVSFPLQSTCGRSVRVAAVAGHFLEFLDLEHPALRPRLAHELRQAPSTSRSSPPAEASIAIGSAMPFALRVSIGRRRCCSSKDASIRCRISAARSSTRAWSHRRSAAPQQTTRRDADVRSPRARRPAILRLPSLRRGRGRGDAAERLRCRGAHARATATATATRARSASSVQFEACRSGMARRGTCRARVEAGQRAGDIKPAHLDDRLDWSAVFEGATARITGCSPRSHDEHRGVLDRARCRTGAAPAGRMRERSGLLKEAWYAAARSPELTPPGRSGASFSSSRSCSGAPTGAPPWRWKIAAPIATRRCRRVRSSTASSAARITAGSTTTRDAASRCPRAGRRRAADMRRAAASLPSNATGWSGCGWATRRPAARAVPDALLGHARVGNLLHGHGVSERGDAPRRELHGRAAHDLRARGLVPSACAQARPRRSSNGRRTACSSPTTCRTMKSDLPAAS